MGFESLKIRIENFKYGWAVRTQLKVPINLNYGESRVELKTAEDGVKVEGRSPLISWERAPILFVDQAGKHEVDMQTEIGIGETVRLHDFKTGEEVDVTVMPTSGMLAKLGQLANAAKEALSRRSVKQAPPVRSDKFQPSQELGTEVEEWPPYARLPIDLRGNHPKIRPGCSDYPNAPYDPDEYS